MSVAGTTLTFDGTGLLTSGFTEGIASVSGVFADSVQVNSNSVVATWTNGVPATSGPVTPFLALNHTTEATTLYASITGTIDNTLAVTAASTVSCSFAGGCELSVTANGLTSALASGAAHLTVAGEECEFDADNSDSSSAKCWLPVFKSIASINDFALEESTIIYGTEETADTDDEANKPWDSVNKYVYTSTASNCYFETSFDHGYVGLVKSIQYMMIDFDRTLFVDFFKIEGSNDGSSYTELHVADETIHEGYNTVSFNTPAAYRHYKFSNSEAGGCKVGEVLLNGWVVHNNEDSSFTAEVNYVIDEVDILISAAAVTYESSFTPSVSGISPQQVSVLGQSNSETVTFTGTGFSSNCGDIYIEIDGI
eukprot:scpid3683/ scgid24216/ 